MVLINSGLSKVFDEYHHFSLKNSFGEIVSSQNLLNRNGLLVVFTCNHCPYALALWDRLVQQYSEIKQYGFDVVAINPNINPDYPDDSPENMQILINKRQVPFQYLVDDTQSVAKQYQATCTPDFYLLNQEMKLIYRGAYDDNWKDESKVDVPYIMNAIQFYDLNKMVPNDDIQQSIGCSIKWVD